MRACVALVISRHVSGHESRFFAEADKDDSNLQIRLAYYIK